MRRPSRSRIVLPLTLALAAGAFAAPPAAASVTTSLHDVRTSFSATSQQTFSLPAGRQVVTATVSMTPRDPLSQDWRCDLQTISPTGVPTLLDEAVVRAQQQVSPIRKESNAFPHFTLHGVVNGPAALRMGCTRVAGSGVAPLVDRLTVLSDLDTSAASITRTATTLASLPSVGVSGQVRAVATLSLDPQDTRSGDLTCGLYARPGGAEVPALLDETVVRVRRTEPPATGPSNALPRITLVGLGNAGTGGVVYVSCTPVAVSRYVQPLVPRARLVTQRVTGGQVRVGQDMFVADEDDTLVSILQPSRDGSRNPVSVVATLTLIPQTSIIGNISCRLLNRSTVLDEVRVSVRAAVSPDPLTSNAFPRITLVGNGTFGPSTRIGVACTPYNFGGMPYAQPRVDRVTMVFLPTTVSTTF